MLASADLISEMIDGKCETLKFPTAAPPLVPGAGHFSLFPPTIWELSPVDAECQTACLKVERIMQTPTTRQRVKQMKIAAGDCHFPGEAGEKLKKLSDMVCNCTPEEKPHRQSAGAGFWIKCWMEVPEAQFSNVVLSGLIEALCRALASNAFLPFSL